jgi:hypothetical protein
MNRIEIIKSQLKSNSLSQKKDDTITITDNRSGKHSYK